MGGWASRDSSRFLEKLVCSRKEWSQSGRKEWKTGAERRRSVAFSLLWGGNSQRFLSFGSIHNLTGLFAKLTWGYIFVICEQKSPDFCFGAIFIFQCYSPPWDEVFVCTHGHHCFSGLRMEMSTTAGCARASSKHCQTVSHCGFSPGLFCKVWNPKAVNRAGAPARHPLWLFGHLFCLALPTGQLVIRYTAAQISASPEKFPPLPCLLWTWLFPQDNSALLKNSFFKFVHVLYFSKMCLHTQSYLQRKCRSDVLSSEKYCLSADTVLLPLSTLQLQYGPA